jgi:hypothetical protein
VLGVVARLGRTWWRAVILLAFAIGHSLLLAGGLVGLSLGFEKPGSAIGRFGSAIKIVAGLLMIGVDFYLPAGFTSRRLMSAGLSPISLLAKLTFKRYSGTAVLQEMNGRNIVPLANWEQYKWRH